MEAHYQYINDLVTKSQNGDTNALSDIAEFYSPLISASIQRCILREPRLLRFKEDVEAEVFLILKKLVENYDPNLSYFSYYISTRLDYAIINQCRQTILGLKSNSRFCEEVSFSDISEDLDIVNHDDPFGKIHIAQAIQGAIDKLNPRQKEAIEAYFFDNLTQQEAAKKLGITQASFCKRLQRGLNSMRELLSEDFI